jgi:hypothetical protein
MIFVFRISGTIPVAPGKARRFSSDKKNAARPAGRAALQSTNL